MKALLLTLAAVLALVLPAGAFAHATVSSTSPSYRERLERSPSLTVIRFNQVVQAIPKAIVVRDADGRKVSGVVRIAPDGRSLAAPVPKLQRGAYSVRWQALSVSDGHVISGVYTFGVQVAAPPPTEITGARGPTVLEKVVRWLTYLGLALLAGGLAFRLLILPPSISARLEQRIYLVAGAGLLLTLDAALAGYLLRVDAALQLPFERFVYADLLPFTEGTRFGRAWVWLTLGCALVAALMTAAWLTQRRGVLWPAWALSLALGAAFSLSGHSASEPNSDSLSVIADWAHISAASVWLGGLVVLAFLVWRGEPALRRDAFLRFSRLAGILVAVVLAAGVYLATRRLPEVTDLWETGYGRTLVLKLALVSLAIAWGAAHHFLVRPALMRRRTLEHAGRVTRSLLGESVTGMAILLVAAVLVNSAPPA